MASGTGQGSSNTKNVALEDVRRQAHALLGTAMELVQTMRANLESASSAVTATGVSAFPQVVSALSPVHVLGEGFGSISAILPFLVGDSPTPAEVPSLDGLRGALSSLMGAMEHRGTVQVSDILAIDVQGELDRLLEGIARLRTFLGSDDRR